MIIIRRRAGWVSSGMRWWAMGPVIGRRLGMFIPKRRRTTAFTRRHRWRPQRRAQRGHAMLQFFIQLLETAYAIQLKCRDPESNQDTCQQKREPQHESPPDGFIEA